MKVKFAHQLRAIAALSVVIYHYWGIFFSPAVRTIIGMPASFAPAKPVYAQHAMAAGQGGLLYGVFGVGVFFLISGFVIPISLRNISTGAFLVRRFFRIYPVYWLCLLISLCMYLICSWYWHTPLSDRTSLKYLLQTLPLLHSVTGIASLDFVCWSLAVEVKFYVVFALVFLAGRNAHKVLALSVGFLTLCCAAAYLAQHDPNPQSMLSLLASDMKFITFMFLGCLFYYVLYDELTVEAALGYGTIIYVLFLTTTASYEGSIAGPLARNYTYALVLFSVCYVLRERFRDNRVLDFVADISFPLYLLHSTIGYVLMSILIDRGASFTLAWVISLGLVLLVAFGVHKYVENPVNAFGKKVSNLSGRPSKPMHKDAIPLEGSP
jgi:peptidoglycan/LPS O-acetylase OafA/YrhL